MVDGNPFAFVGIASPHGTVSFTMLRIDEGLVKDYRRRRSVPSYYYVKSNCSTKDHFSFYSSVSLFSYYCHFIYFSLIIEKVR